MKRGDIVLLHFPFTDGRSGKNRPALVVQNDLDNSRLSNTIVAMISGNTRFSHSPTQLLVDPAVPDGKLSGVLGPSVVKATSFFTVEQQDVHRVIGRLSAGLL